ncbi:MAG TPA: MBL fold metallo-hydrolase [Sedimentisphaerales bacterium]|nr:MBL fold metallo-hydrolase [Sedimentisphaerales bacterium]
MKLTFHGAAGEVTGSSHIISVNGKNVMLDCGLYQGKRKEAFEKNRQFPFEPSDIDAVVLSHAHMDHSGNLPTLVRKGFAGKIWCTDATAELCGIMFRDCAHIQELDVAYVNKKRARQGKNLFEPLYTRADAEMAAGRLESVKYDQKFSPVDGMEVSFFDAGHILGSALTAIDVSCNSRKRRLMYTGDIGRYDIPILRDPVPVKNIDYLITESTYGDRVHPVVGDVKRHLQHIVNKICETKGKLIIPAFSIGRTQLLVYMLNRLYVEGKICPLPVYVDSPLSSAATEIYARYKEYLDEDAFGFTLNGSRPFSFNTLRYTQSVDESKMLNTLDGPMIIISASGMMEAGRVLHHIKNNIGDSRNIILVVGYQAANTLGRKIVDREPVVKIFGEEHELKVQVEQMAALSAHGDSVEMLKYFDKCGLKSMKRAFCVHGEGKALTEWAAALKTAGISDAVVPAAGESYEIA